MPKTKPNPKTKKKLPWIYILDIVVLAAAVILVGFGLWNSMADKKEHVCETAGAEHVLELNNDTFNKTNLSLRQCDSIKIVNRDTQEYSLAFGVHDRHVAYPGFTQTTLQPNEFIVVDAFQAGAFRMHDHLRDNAFVNLTIQSAE